MNIKICCKCGQEKVLTEFDVAKRFKDGRQRYCKVCRSELSNSFYEKNKKHYIDKVRDRQKQNVDRFKQVKQQCVCSCCGEHEVCCLDYHHLDASTKEIGLAESARGSSWKKITSELVKCIPVCRNCHAKIHNGIITLSDNDSILYNQILIDIVSSIKI